MPTPSKKKVSLEGGGLEGPLLMGLEWLFFGPFAVPHPSPATKRKSSLSLLIEMQEPPHPCSSPQAPLGKARGPAEPSARRRLGTVKVHLPAGSGVIAPLQWRAPPACGPSVPWGDEKKSRCPCSPPNYLLTHTRRDSPRGNEHPGLGNGQALEVAAVQGAEARMGCLATARARGAGGGAG